jgi:hypothetical protein
MTGIIKLFKKDALNEAYLAGVEAAKADPTNWREIFDAGERRGSGWLNEAANAPGFMEFMAAHRQNPLGSFPVWFGRREKDLAIVVDKAQHELIATEKKIEISRGKKLITLAAIERAVRYAFHISLEDLRYNPTRASFVKRPRFYAWYLAYHHCHNHLTEIGKRWGSRDHATAIHGAKTVFNNATNYSADRLQLTMLYKKLAEDGYDIFHFVQDDDMPSRSGNKRSVVKRVKLNL